MTSSGRHVVIGAGPAGLTAAWQLIHQNQPCTVLEQDAQPGGLSRTIWRQGYGFDIGGHRFYTKSPEIQRLWRQVLGDDFLSVKRLSRIYYRGKFFDYPLKAGNALAGLGVGPSLAVLASYLHRKVRPLPREDTFEQYVINRFGKRLYDTFFREYTEKVWGVPCEEISSAWAAQRIQGLSLAAAVRSAVLGRRADDAKTLIDEFDYPRRGPGQLWDRMADNIAAGGGDLRFGHRVTAIHHDGRRITSVEAAAAGPAGPAPPALPVVHLYSSMPLQALLFSLNPRPPAAVLAAARALRYRDFITVNLCLEGGDLFPDQWIYIHEPRVRVGRIQNFRNWSPALTPGPHATGIGMEYFCAEGDDLWTASDEKLCERARRELDHLGLARGAAVKDAFVVRVKKAYPFYDTACAENLRLMRDYLSSFENLHPMGRNGLHRYNNQDHSMLTALRAVENATRGHQHDLWEINAEASYLEKIR